MPKKTKIPEKFLPINIPKKVKHWWQYWKKKPLSECEPAAIRSFMHAIHAMGGRRVRLDGNVLTWYSWEPQLGRKRATVKYTITIDKVQMKASKGRDAFDAKYQRGIKERK